MEIYQGKSWKFWTLVIGVPVLILIVVLIILFSNGGLGDKDASSSQDPSNLASTQQGGSSGQPNWGVTPPEGEEGSTEPFPVSDGSMVINRASTAYGGKVLAYEEFGSRSEVKVAIGGSEENVRSFTLDLRTLIFDAETNTIVDPNKLTEADKSRLLVVGSEHEDQYVELIILNDNPKLLFSTVSEVEQSEDRIVLRDSVRSLEYQVPAGHEFLNALTGVPYDPSKIKVTDKLFVYPQEGYDFSVGTSDSFAKVPVDKIYVYPNAR